MTCRPRCGRLSVRQQGSVRCWWSLLGGRPHVGHEAAAVHHAGHAARRRGGVAARGAGAANYWGSTPWPPRTHQEKKKATLTKDLLRMPDWKFTPHALGLKTGSALVVADQYCTCWVPILKGWPGGSVGPGTGTLGSMRLASSWIVGSRQPKRPPTVLRLQ